MMTNLHTMSTTKLLAMLGGKPTAVLRWHIDQELRDRGVYIPVVVRDRRLRLRLRIYDSRR